MSKIFKPPFRFMIFTLQQPPLHRVNSVLQVSQYNDLAAGKVQESSDISYSNKKGRIWQMFSRGCRCLHLNNHCYSRDSRTGEKPSDARILVSVTVLYFSILNQSYSSYRCLPRPSVSSADYWSAESIFSFQTRALYKVLNMSFKTESYIEQLMLTSQRLHDSL